MIHHIHSLICIRSIVDKNTGLASYIDIIEGIKLKDSTHLTLPPFTLVSKYWIKDGIEDDQTLQIEVSRKKVGKNKRTILQEMNFPIERKGTSILVQLDVQNLVLEEVGIWEIEVKWKIKNIGSWKKGAIIPLNITAEKIVSKPGTKRERK